jgi:hypothetical protein
MSDSVRSASLGVQATNILACDCPRDTTGYVILGLCLVLTTGWAVLSTARPGWFGTVRGGITLLWLLYRARQRATPSAPVPPSAPTVVGAGSSPGGGGDRPTGARPKGRPSESCLRKPADAVRRVDRRRGKGAVHGEEVRIYIDPDEDEVTFKS